jgi:hypothetical protein
MIIFLGVMDSCFAQEWKSYEFANDDMNAGNAATETAGSLVQGYSHMASSWYYVWDSDW